MRWLKSIGNFCLNSYSVEKEICNMNILVLQELGDLTCGFDDFDESATD